jgi:hypothetical protein
MAEENWKSELAAGFVNNVHLILMGLGAVLLVLGLTSGIHGWLAIDLPWARGVAIALGILLLITGAITSRYTDRPPNPDSLKVKINSPTAGSNVHNIEMAGTIAKTKLPKDYELRVIKHYSNGGWAPIGSVHINKDGTWQSTRCSIGGNPTDSVRVSVNLVGPGGKVIIDYFDQATSVHEAGMKSAGPLPAGVASHLPPIRNMPPDMLECAYTQYTRDHT